MATIRVNNILPVLLGLFLIAALGVGVYYASGNYTLDTRSKAGGFGYSITTIDELAETSVDTVKPTAMQFDEAGDKVTISWKTEDSVMSYVLRVHDANETIVPSDVVFSSDEERDANSDKYIWVRTSGSETRSKTHSVKFARVPGETIYYYILIRGEEDDDLILFGSGGEPSFDDSITSPYSYEVTEASSSDDLEEIIGASGETGSQIESSATGEFKNLLDEAKQDYPASED